MNVEFVRASSLKEKPKDITKVVFGKTFTDYMFEMDYNRQDGWHNAMIVPYQNIPLSPANSALHYGQTVFEGMKAFKTKDNAVRVFRIDDHLKRLNRSCEILDIPNFDVSDVKKAMLQLLNIEKDWVPVLKGSSLYIRPFIFNTDEFIGIGAGKAYKFMIILSPVSSIYVNGFGPVKIAVEDKYVRAVPGGLGEAKTAANYAASLHAGISAHKKGYDQVLWLDGVEHKYVEEVGSMNIFFKINGKVITPALNGSILNGITRRTVIKIAKDQGFDVVERRISIDEVYKAYKDGSLEEVFGTGTAAIISPVGELLYKEEKMIINNNKVGELSQKLYDYITDMQNGNAEDIYEFFTNI